MRGARPNLLVLFSDEHDGAVLGAAGHPQVQTPHLTDDCLLQGLPHPPIYDRNLGPLKAMARQ